MSSPPPPHHSAADPMTPNVSGPASQPSAIDTTTIMSPAEAKFPWRKLIGTVWKWRFGIAFWITLGVVGWGILQENWPLSATLLLTLRELSTEYFSFDRVPELRLLLAIIAVLLFAPLIKALLMIPRLPALVSWFAARFFTNEHFRQAALKTIYRESGFLIPLLALCLAVGIINVFDRFFVKEDVEKPHVLAASIVGSAASPNGGFSAVCSEMLLWRTRPERIAASFHWPTLPLEPAVASRVATSRFISKSVDSAAVIGSVATVAWCLFLILNRWNQIEWKHLLLLLFLALATSRLIHVLWWSLNPFNKSLPNELILHARQLAGRTEVISLLHFNQKMFMLWVLPLVAATAGFIVSKKERYVEKANKQLQDLTVLLYLAVTVLVPNTFVIVTMMLWGGSLLPQGKDSEGAMVLQLALALGLSFGVAYTLFLAAVHIPAVFAITLEPCDDGKVVSLSEYYLRSWKFLGILSPIVAGLLAKLITSLLG